MAFETVTFNDFQADFAGYLSMVKRRNNPIRVAYESGEYVLIYPQNFEMDETDYLMSTEANRKHLEEALNESPEHRTTYNSVDEICEEFGIKP